MHLFFPSDNRLRCQNTHGTFFKIFSKYSSGKDLVASCMLFLIVRCVTGKRESDPLHSWSQYILVNCCQRHSGAFYLPMVFPCWKILELGVAAVIREVQSNSTVAPEQQLAACDNTLADFDGTAADAVPWILLLDSAMNLCSLLCLFQILFLF
eukprot:4043334-Ditylum_brightwellii.AAC.1